MKKNRVSLDELFWRKNEMKRFILLLALYAFIGTVSAYDVIGSESDPALKREIELAPFDVTPLEIKKSIIDVMIKSRWEIVEHKKNYIIGVYNGVPKVKISFDENKLTISEVPTSANFKERWLNTLQGHILHRLNYYHQVRVALKLL
jgi:hypothetical protein